jgi:hypothetical protein
MEHSEDQASNEPSESDTAAPGASIGSAGNHASDPHLPSAMPISGDAVDDLGHAFDDAASATIHMSTDALDCVGATLDHLISTTNLFDVPPFDLDIGGPY